MTIPDVVGSSRSEYYTEEEKDLVKFLAEFYPKERDRGRSVSTDQDHAAY